MFYGDSKCTYRAVIPQSAKPPSHGYSMQAKAPPHDMREDFAIASEGIAKPARYPLGSILMECKGGIYTANRLLSGGIHPFACPRSEALQVIIPRTRILRLHTLLPPAVGDSKLQAWAVPITLKGQAVDLRIIAPTSDIRIEGIAGGERST